ncbi:EF-Tu/IF-2/RF-3 family GTPase, partial [Oceanobacter sp. 2_MG-2023]|uniref:EF-Tu/IF-2/RF-3 family GTPase n=1 Tax=Oceanobacter sp. 2_MG-2023 TaxID=3062619 RepID=UPI002733C057
LHMIVDHVTPPPVDLDCPFQMQISALDNDSFVGVIGVGRISRGKIKPGTDIQLIYAEGKIRKGRLLEVKGFLGLNRVAVEEASAGDIVCVSGIEGLNISDTLC